MLQKGLALLGLAKQTAKGGAATAPQYTIGLTGGTLGKVDIEQNDLDTTWDTRGQMGAERTGVVPGADIECIATPKLLGFLLKMILGTEVVSGSGPYVHTFTSGESQPYATLFGMIGGGNKTAISDAKLSELELSWDGSGSVKVKTTWVGCSYSLTSSWTPGATKESVAGGNTIRPAGGSITIGGTAFPTTAGSIKISADVEAIMDATTSLPSDVVEKDLSVDISLTVRPEDLALFKLAVTGSTTGTALTTDVVYTTAAIQLQGPGTDEVTFSLPSWAIMAEMPEVDPAGGPAEIQVQGKGYRGSGGESPITAALTNAVTAAY